MVDQPGDEPMPKGAVKVMQRLDLCVELDEPEQLMRELETIAEAIVARNHPGAHRRNLWEIVAEHARAAGVEMRRLNEPPD